MSFSHSSNNKLVYKLQFSVRHPHSQVYCWEIYHSDSFICHCKRLCKERRTTFVLILFLINKAIKGTPTALHFVVVTVQVVVVALSYCCCCWLFLSQKRLTNDSKGRYWGISLARWRMAVVAWRCCGIAVNAADAVLHCCKTASQMQLNYNNKTQQILRRHATWQLVWLARQLANLPSCRVPTVTEMRRLRDSNDDDDGERDCDANSDCDWGANPVRETNNKWSRLVIYLCKAIKYDFVFFFVALCE